MVTHLPVPPGPGLCKVGSGACQRAGRGCAAGVARKADLAEHLPCGGLCAGQSEPEPHPGPPDSTPSVSPPPPPMPAVLTCLWGETEGHLKAGQPQCHCPPSGGRAQPGQWGVSCGV